jgi:hypothetical protein
VFAEPISSVSRLSVWTDLPLALLLSNINLLARGMGLLEVCNVAN